MYCDKPGGHATATAAVGIIAPSCQWLRATFPLSGCPAVQVGSSETRAGG